MMPSGIRPALVMAPLLWGCSVDDGIAVPMQEVLDADLQFNAAHPEQAAFGFGAGGTLTVTATVTVVYRIGS